MKHCTESLKEADVRRAPRGARGLKLIAVIACWLSVASRPARGAWIETKWEPKSGDRIGVAPRAGRVD